MAAELFLIDRKNPVTASELMDVPLTLDEEIFLRTVHHDEKRAEQRDRRKALRLFLSRKLNISPELIPLIKGSSGEIRLNGIPLFISVASRGDHIAIAWSHSPLGVDIENSILKMPISALHAEEIHFLNSCADEIRPHKTAMIWAAKEAAWKALNLPITANPKNLMIEITASGEVIACYKTKNKKVLVAGQVSWNSDMMIAVAVLDDLFQDELLFNEPVV